ncbi:MAG: nuclear transport factor 2 family protein [Cyclobacteriaceae bacterium]|nr:nuclear transport factor 2 family protein [Cyclobacteriaceae bacterium]
MKRLNLLLLLCFLTLHTTAQQASKDDLVLVINTLESYKKAIEKLDTTGTGKLFASKSVVIESGKIEGRYQDYLAHHLGPELGDFKSFTFSDYKADVTVDLPYAFATETYKYTIVLKKDNSVIERKGVATTILKKENGSWKIWQTHTSARKP